MRSIRLTDPMLEAELTRTDYGGGLIVPGLLFVCPLCLEANEGGRAGVHSHLVPYEPGAPAPRTWAPAGRKVLVWGNPGGSTLADLTLSPSYLAGSNGVGCRFHCFVRSGVLQVLDDSRGPR